MKIIQFVLTTEYTELHGVRTQSGLYDKTNSVTLLKTSVRLHGKKRFRSEKKN